MIKMLKMLIGLAVAPCWLLRERVLIQKARDLDSFKPFGNFKPFGSNEYGNAYYEACQLNEIVAEKLKWTRFKNDPWSPAHRSATQEAIAELKKRWAHQNWSPPPQWPSGA